MKYIFLIGLFAILLSSCRPSMDMNIGKFDTEREMPRFCFTERMFFYELSTVEEDLQLWVYSKERLTIDQLISQPLHILFAEKKKKNIQYHLRYKDLVNRNIENKNENSIQLKFVKYEENDTIDLTAKYQFKVNTEYNGSQYSLKIGFPKSIVEQFEEPVIGIITDTPEPFKKEKNEPQDQRYNPNGDSRQNQIHSDENQPSQPHQFVRKIEDIKLWFNVIL